MNRTCLAVVNYLGYPLPVPCGFPEHSSVHIVHNLHENDSLVDKRDCFQHAFVPYSPFREMVNELLVYDQ